VRAIAARVTIPDDQIDARRGLNRQDLDDFETKLERSAVGRILAEAKAAGILFQHLNQPTPLLPNWWDAVVGGFPILDNSVRRQGLELLALWARTEVSYMLHASDRDVQTGQVRPFQGSESKDQPSRLVQIGFDTDELIQFLDELEIPHNLGAIMNQSPRSAMSWAANGRITQPEIGQSAAKLKFRGPLGEVLGTAAERARDPHDPDSVFEQVWLMAQEPRPMHPLVGIDIDEGGRRVKWESWGESRKGSSGSDSTVKFLTAADLRDRKAFREIAKERKKRRPEKDAP
jgi:hypothetical protein